MKTPTKYLETLYKIAMVASIVNYCSVHITVGFDINSIFLNVQQGIRLTSTLLRCSKARSCVLLFNNSRAFFWIMSASWSSNDDTTERKILFGNSILT